MDSTFIVPIAVALVTPIGAAVIWLLNRKKHVADIYGALSDAHHTTVETMQLTMQELRIELTEAKEQMAELIQENELLRNDLHELKAQNEQLLVENRAFKCKIEELTEYIKSMNQE